MTKILICDDDQKDALFLKGQCESYFDQGKLSVIPDVLITSNPLDIATILPDILILDVEMPNQNGVSIKDDLCKQGDKPLIIFVTSHKEAMANAFGRNVIDFIEKPADRFHIETALKCAFNLLPKETFLHVNDHSKISSKNIVYIKSEKNYTELSLANNEFVSNQRKPLHVWEKELEDFDFLRINESYLVNCQYICIFNKSVIALEDERGLLMVSRRRRNYCKKVYDAYCQRLATLL